MASERRQITLINNQGLRDKGGGPTIIRNIVERLCPWHDITLISFDPPAETAFDIAQVTLPPQGEAYWRLKPFSLAQHYKAVIETALAGTADVLIAMDCHLGLAFSSLPARRRAYISLSCIPRQEWYGTPQSLPLIFLQYAYLERRMICGADITVVASESQRREIARFELLPGFSPLVLRPVFAQPDAAPGAIPAPSEADASAQTVFLTVCRLVGVKRVDRILEIADRLRNANCRFIIVGDGPLAFQLEAEANARGLTEIVRFAGPSDHPEEYYGTADILLHPSAYESFGIAVFEAMCHGVIPACATGAGSTIGISADIQHGENGVLLDFDDMDAVIRDLTPLLNDDGLRRRMKENAQRVARSMLQEDYVARLAQALDLKMA